MGRWRSGQSHQTVNLAALCLRRFEPVPAHHRPRHGGVLLPHLKRMAGVFNRPDSSKFRHIKKYSKKIAFLRAAGREAFFCILYFVFGIYTSIITGIINGLLSISLCVSLSKALIMYSLIFRIPGLGCFSISFS